MYTLEIDKYDRIDERINKFLITYINNYIYKLI